MGSTPSGRVDGVVTTVDGTPVAAFSVTVSPLSDTGQPLLECASLTAEDGSYSWELPPREYEMLAVCDDPAGESRQRATVRAGSSTSADFRIEN